jgi:hypothetical protein
MVSGRRLPSGGQYGWIFMKFFRLINKWWWQIAAGLVILLAAAAALLWWPVPQQSDAYFVLNYDSHRLNTGQRITVKVQVGSRKAANAVDVTVRYPQDALKVVSTSTKQSRFDMVLFPPDSKTEGEVRFLQATAAPFSDGPADGLVGTIEFEAKKETTVSLLTTGKVIANDSKGTDLTATKPDKMLWQEILKD